MSSQTIDTKPPAHPAPLKPATSARWRIPALLLGTVAVGGAIWYFAFDHKGKAASGFEGEGAEKAARGVAVEAVYPKRGGLERVSAMTGSVHAFESANLFANVSGYLKSQEIEVDGATVPVDIGVRVKKGDLLAVIDVPELLADLARAEADVKQAEAQVAQADAKVESAKADLKASEAAVAEAEAEVGRFTAKKNETSKAYQRYKGLRGMSAVDQDVVDQKQDAFESAVSAESSSRAAVATAKAQVAAARAKVGQAEADRMAAKSNVAVAQARLKKSQVYVDYTRIRSPYTGVITDRAYFPGDFIRSAAEGNTRAMLTVARTDLMRIVTKISDLDVPFADVGDPAIVTLDALPGLKLQGKVSRFSEAEDPTERTMRTEIDLPNAPDGPARGRLREGMYGLATIVLQPPSKHLTVPTACIIDHGGGANPQVLVAGDGKAKLVPVKVGTDDGIRIEILDGLDAKDEVLIPNGTVSEGTPVVVTHLPVASKEAASH